MFLFRSNLYAMLLYLNTTPLTSFDSKFNRCSCYFLDFKCCWWVQDNVSLSVCVCWCVFLQISGQGNLSVSLCHLILATPFPQHYKGASRRQTLLVQMKDRAWETDRQNIPSEFQWHKETLCSAGNGLSFHFSVQVISSLADK